MSAFRLAFLALAFWLSMPPAAFAYIDPVTGSFLLQGVIGAVAAILVSIRAVRTKIARFFGRKAGSAESAGRERKS